MDGDVANIGERMREERQRLGLTQAEAALYCEVSADMWSKYERGLHAPRRMVIRAFAAAGADEQFINTGIRSIPLVKHRTPSENPEVINEAMTLMQRTLDLMPTTTEERLLRAFRRAEGARKNMFYALMEEIEPQSEEPVAVKVANGPS